MPIRDETTLNLLSEKEFGSAVDAVLKDDSGYRIKIADVRNSLESDPDYLEKYFPKVIELMTVPEAINTSEALKIIEKYGKRLGVVYAETHDFLRLETNFNDVWCTQAPSAKALAYAIFIRDYADIYKYHSVEMPDTDKVRLIREGLVAGIEALTKLKSERRLSNKPNEFDLEDRMTLFLIFGLCDPEAGDIDSAKALVETINNNFLKERAIK